MTSNDVLNTITNIQGELNPVLGDQYKAPEFFKNGLNQAFNYNLPLLRQGAALSEGAYTLPGKLMDEYNANYGNTFGGPSGMSRINSVLGRLGNQFSLVDLVSKLSDQQGGRIEDMSKNLTDQYGMMIKGLQDKYNMNLPIFQSLKSSEDQAASRNLQASLARQAREDAAQQALQFQKFLETPKPNQVPLPSTGMRGATAGSGFLFPSGQNPSSNSGLFQEPVQSNPTSGALKYLSSTPLANSYGLTAGSMFGR